MKQNSNKRQSLSKKRYQTPEIKIYGKIEQITYGATGSGFDSAAQPPGKPPN